MPNSYAYTIARRLFRFSNARDTQTTIPLIGIALGVVVMLVSIAIVIGFKQTVTEKVAGFEAHLQLVNFDNNNTYEYLPINVTDSLLNELRQIDNVAVVAPFITKPAIFKTDSAFQGVVCKASDDMTFFRDALIEGDVPRSDKEVLISYSLAKALQLQCGDNLNAFFFAESIRQRKLIISGIYRTGLEEFDARFVLTTMSLLRQVNQWAGNSSDEAIGNNAPAQCSGIDIRATTLSDVPQVEELVWRKTANKLDEDGNALYLVNLVQRNPAIFAWLDLLDTNVLIIILLMCAVSAFAIVSGLIILMLNSVQFIGLMKALGADNSFIMRIFRFQALHLILKGVLIGNAIALPLLALQYYTHIIPLDPVTYYVPYVPIAFPWILFIALDLLTVAIAALVVLAPTYLIAKVDPARVLQYE